MTETAQPKKRTESEFLHDLSNPLAAALFWSELMQDPKFSMPAPEAASKIHQLLLAVKSALEARRAELTEKSRSAA